MRANNPAEFSRAVERLARLLESPELRASRDPNLDRMIVEGYIPGREVAVEGLLTEGVAAHPGDFRQARSAGRPVF